MDEDHVIVGPEPSLPDQVDETCRGLPCVDRVKENSLGLGKEPHGFDHLWGRQGVPGTEVVAEAETAFSGD